jgi:hypothetical protein
MNSPWMKDQRQQHAGRPTDTVATRFERGKRDSFQVATKHELWILDYMDSFYFIFLTYFFFFFRREISLFLLLSLRRPRLSPLYIIHQLTFPVPTDFLFVYFFMFSSQPNGSFEQAAAAQQEEKTTM